QTLPRNIYDRRGTQSDQAYAKTGQHKGRERRDERPEHFCEYLEDRRQYVKKAARETVGAGLGLVSHFVVIGAFDAFGYIFEFFAHFFLDVRNRDRFARHLEFFTRRDRGRHDDPKYDISNDSRAVT